MLSAAIQINYGIFSIITCDECKLSFVMTNFAADHVVIMNAAFLSDILFVL